MATKKAAKKSEITIDMLDELKGELRELDLQWAQKLVDQILADPEITAEEKNGVTLPKIYNVFNNIVRNNSWKVLVYNQGKILRDLKQGQLDSALK